MPLAIRLKFYAGSTVRPVALPNAHIDIFRKDVMCYANRKFRRQ